MWTQKKVKISRRIVLSIIAVLAPASISFGRYSGGTGEPNEPYRIATPNDLNDIGNHVEDFNNCFVMVNDINLSEYTGAQFNIIGPNFTTPFTGVFDGNGHTIFGFTFKTDAFQQAVGIFGWVFEPNAAIDDLGLIEPNIACPNSWYVGSLVGFMADGTVSGCSCEDGRISGYRDVGGLVGMNVWGTIEDCRVSAVVSSKGNCTGGLVGSNGGTISSSDSSGSVVGEYFVGGLVGVSGIHDADQHGTIENCHSTANVKSREDAAGGLVGVIGDSVHGAVVQRCYATGNVEANTIAGGLLGLAWDYCNISNCYALGGVDANNWVGGLVGGIRDSLVEHCYAAGPVSGDANVGALAGRSHDANSIFVKSYWDSDINPDVNGIGNVSDPNVTGKSTAEMKMESTFIDWDFQTVWGIRENETYPFLRSLSLTQNAVREILRAIAEKKQLRLDIDAAIERERTAHNTLEDLLASGNYGDLTPDDIIEAQYKIRSAGQIEQRCKAALIKSIGKLYEALYALGLQPPIWEPPTTDE